MPVLRGITGRYAGKTIELDERELVIGRDPYLANLVYPLSSEEISRKHCSVHFDQKTGKFVLKDYSRNGTFLAPNEKLVPGRPYYLNKGNRFFLVDPKEVFEVNISYTESTGSEELRPYTTINARESKDVRLREKERINRVEICFENEYFPYPEQHVVENLIKHFELEKFFTPDVHISTSYGGGNELFVEEALATGECPDELAMFVIARAFILGFSDKEIENIIPRPFSVSGTLGVLIAGHMKNPWG